MNPEAKAATDDVLRRVQGEFLEMPGQRLTVAQTGSGPLAVAQLGPRELVIQTVVEKKALVGESSGR